MKTMRLRRCSVALLLLLACGGESARRGSVGGSGASAGASVTGGAAGAAVGGVGGSVAGVGGSVAGGRPDEPCVPKTVTPAGDGCNSCNCTDRGTWSCSHQTCVPPCEAGFEDCDGDPANGCETDIAHSIDDCGACGAPCVFAGGSCEDGICVAVAGSGAGGSAGTAGSGPAGAGSGGSGGVPPGAECAPGEAKFSLCGANFQPDGDCFCGNGEWLCPQVGCAPCPVAPRDDCPAADLIYAKDPTGSAHCCAYMGACEAPPDWSQYTTARDCMRAAN